jgi:hypothetical protein
LCDVHVRRNVEARDDRPSAFFEGRDDELPFPTRIADNDDRSKPSRVGCRDDDTLSSDICNEATDDERRHDRRTQFADANAVDDARAIAQDHPSVRGRRNVDAHASARISERFAAHRHSGRRPAPRNSMTAVAERSEPVDDPGIGRRREIGVEANVRWRSRPCRDTRGDSARRCALESPSRGRDQASAE